MKQSAIRLAVLSAFGLASAQAMATGFVSLPSGGFTVGSDTTPYTLCNTTGNFGSVASTAPSAGANNTCAVFPASRNVSPDSSVTNVVATRTSVPIVYTGSTLSSSITVARMDERVWSNGQSGSNQVCIYGLRYSMTNNPVAMEYDEEEDEYEPVYLELNGFARAGFSAFTTASSVQAAYYYSAISDEVLFRIGRTYTSVQHRANSSTPSLAASGYVSRPITTSAPTSTSINGVNSWSSPLPVPTAAQQAAGIDTNWVEFTTDNNYLDDDGTTLPDSSQLYVKVTGTNACPQIVNGEAVLTNNAYSFRQTGQEEAPFVEFKVPGYIPNGANVNITY
ncbi:hypothetical protein A7981_11500 [Methylovorus sp. MM2]|uniref:hypothetical protein n=1 Tax=Methylovorus sp. MM2 TaxID=1848038 RepID=UPI0007E245FC|nr:hypothetical protein [Methylovorus sp. MM2]OAM51341.1 hypothetical protein A7981_11500 [Methylovorus sp. MM2]